MKKWYIILLMMMLLLISGCKKDGKEEAELIPESGNTVESIMEVMKPEAEAPEELTPTPTVETVPETTLTPTPTPTPVPTVVEAEIVEPEVIEESLLIAIDAGHQEHGNYDKEPNGPGSSTMKAKVSSGTQGVSTGLPEYKLNLQVAFKLRDELISRGYEVVMIRETNEIDISNSERAAVANNADADAFIRIHANGSDDHSIDGQITICQTPDNPYNGHLYSECRRLSDLVLQEMSAATGASANYVWETDTMSGINWAMVPTTIVEMGYMTNPQEDELMATEDYQYKLAKGIANGIDLYFGAAQ